MKFTDGTTYYEAGSPGNRSWDWSFGDGTNSTKQNPLHTFALPNTYGVTFTATDKDGYSCPISNVVNVLTAEPAWKEVSPK
jgi:PKD repeat protein